MASDFFKQQKSTKLQVSINHTILLYILKIYNDFFLSGTTTSKFIGKIFSRIFSLQMQNAQHFVYSCLHIYSHSRYVAVKFHSTSLLMCPLSLTPFVIHFLLISLGYGHHFRLTYHHIRGHYTS